MDAREIKELLNFVRKADFDEFELELEGFRLRVVKNKTAPGVAQVAIMPNQPAAAPPPVVVAPVVPAAETPPAAAKPPEEKLHEIGSPMVGTFYRATSPGAKAFCNVGDHVSVGQTLCIIEAMKLMNEIESDISGTVVEIVPDNAQPVEYGEPLFRIRPDR
ncbi:MAG: acetyl-CoA carboxylase biotin carboxyl carrier protein [Acidobacteriota bacterium]